MRAGRSHSVRPPIFQKAADAAELDGAKVVFATGGVVVVERVELADFLEQSSASNNWLGLDACSRENDTADERAPEFVIERANSEKRFRHVCRRRVGRGTKRTMGGRAALVDKAWAEAKEATRRSPLVVEPGVVQLSDHRAERKTRRRRRDTHGRDHGELTQGKPRHLKAKHRDLERRPPANAMALLAAQRCNCGWGLLYE